MQRRTDSTMHNCPLRLQLSYDIMECKESMTNHIKGEIRMNSFCQNCGKPIGPNDRFCMSCGSSISQQAAPQYYPASPAQPPYWQPPYPHPGVPYAVPYIDPLLLECSSKEEYRRKCKNSKYLQSIKAAAIYVYISSGITFLLSILLERYIYLFSIAVLLPLAIVMHTKKIKGCAIALMIHAIISVLISIIMYQDLHGIFWLIAAISAVRAFSIVDKAFEATRLFRWRPQAGDPYS